MMQRSPRKLAHSCLTVKWLETRSVIMSTHLFFVRDRVAPCGQLPAGSFSPVRDSGRICAGLRRVFGRLDGLSLGEAPRHAMDEKFCPARLPGGGTSRLFAEAMARVGYILYPARALPPPSAKR